MTSRREFLAAITSVSVIPLAVTAHASYRPVADILGELQASLALERPDINELTIDYNPEKTVPLLVIGTRT